MRILLLGAGPRLSWAREAIQLLLDRTAVSVVSLDVVEGLPTRPLPLTLGSDRPVILVLIDPMPFAAGQPGEDLAHMDAVRGDAQLAVLAIELARRADRTMKLAGDDASHWLATLAELFAVPLEAMPDSTLPLLVRSPPPCVPIVRDYLSPLWAAPSSPSMPILTWPRDSFIDGDSPGEPLPASIEVAGRGRILAYGPYLPLPAGEWHAIVYLGFSPDIGKLPFIVEADTGGTVSRAFFEVERGGIYTLEFDFTVPDPLHPVELRLISQDSALEGQASLIEVCLEPVALQFGR